MIFILSTLHITIHITAYMSCPAHIELIAEERNDSIVKEKDEKIAKQSKKQMAQARSKAIRIGGGVIN